MGKYFRGEGSIFFNKKKGLWVWEKSIILPDGTKGRKSITAQRQDDLKVKVDRYLLTMGEATLPDNDITVSAWLDKWLNVFVKPSTKQKTYENYRERVRYVRKYIGNRKLKSIKSVELQNIFNELAISGGQDGQGLSAESVNIIRRYLKNAFNVAVQGGIIKVNPVSGTKGLKKEKSDIVALSEEQVRKFLEVAKNGDYIYYGAKYPKCIKHDKGTEYKIKCVYNLVNLGFATGMRIGELRGLAWDCVDFDRNMVTIRQQVVDSRDEGDMFDTPKTVNSNRKISVDKTVMDELKEFKKFQADYADMLGDKFNHEHNLVFTDAFGGVLASNNLRRRYFIKIRGAAGIPENFTIHGMRHTHATLLLKNGVNLKVVSERLGHSSVNVTLNIYAHVLESMEQTASTTWGEIMGDKNKVKKED